VRPMQISPVPVGEVENHNLNRHPDPAGEVEGYAVPSTVQVATNVKLPPTVAPAGKWPTCPGCGRYTLADVCRDYPKCTPARSISDTRLPRVRARQRLDNLARQSDLVAACELAERLQHRWFMSHLRGCLSDGLREQAKMLRTMRGVRLLLFWRRPR
jgi:hypothetical protein